MARIHGIKKDLRKVLKYYQLAGSLLRKSKWENIVIEERDKFKKSHETPKEPI